jgi:hypothetical protein
VRDVPKRTNTFQEVVAIIHAHMAGDAAVEESSYLPHIDTGQQREVDVVIRSKIAGYEVIVSVEATRSGRKADVEWMERMLKKHEKLPTSQLVLVSEAGFTPNAEMQAKAGHAVTLKPADLAAADPAFVVVNALPALWPKQLSVAPDAATLIVRMPDGALKRVRDVPPDALLYLENGEPFLPLAAFFRATYEANIEKLHEQIGLAQMTENLDRYFVFAIEPVIVKVGGEDTHVCARWELSQPPELHEIQNIEFTGTATIRVGQIPLHHKRLGEITYAYGTGELGRDSVLLVVTEDESGPKFTVRQRPASSRKKSTSKRRRKRPG